MVQFNKKYSALYNSFYKNKNYLKKFNNLKKNIPATNKINNILDIGCGTGSFTKLFLNYKSCKILGIDMSSSMIKIARKNVKNNRINFKLKNLHLLKDNKKYDLIFSLFHVLSYQTQKKTINNFFRVINSIMKKNSIFVFDFWNKSGVLKLKPSKRIKIFKKGKFLIKREASPIWLKSKNIVEVKYKIIVNNNNKIQIFYENHKMRYFSIPEIMKILKKYKFKILKNYDHVNNKTNKYSWGRTFIIKKI